VDRSEEALVVHALVLGANIVVVTLCVGGTAVFNWDMHALMVGSAEITAAGSVGLAFSVASAAISSDWGVNTPEIVASVGGAHIIVTTIDVGLATIVDWFGDAAAVVTAHVGAGLAVVAIRIASALVLAAGAVASTHATLVSACTILHGQTSFNVEVALRGVTLRGKHVHRVDVELVESSLQCDRVEIHGRSFSRVDASEVQHQLSIHKHPHVIVSGESELLSAKIRELNADHCSKMKVVREGLVSESLVVDGEERAVAVAILDALAKLMHGSESEVLFNSEIVRVVSVPLVECGCAVNGCAATDRANVDRESVGPKSGVNHTTVVGDCVLHVGKADFEVVNNCSDYDGFRRSVVVEIGEAIAFPTQVLASSIAAVVAFVFIVCIVAMVILMLVSHGVVFCVVVAIVW
jgi:hypothetical protein